MKRLKKSLYFLIPLAFVLVISLAFVPRSFGLENENDRKPSFAGRSELGGQIAYAVESTGASEAGSSEKGGAYYIGKGTTYTMTGGTISGHKKTYGGAVFVDSNAEFIMSGGTITSCLAQYGGAIYVANGGTCRIVGGTIKGNKAETAPAIYVEEGGTLKISDTAVIENNSIGIWVNVSETKENVGGLNSGLSLYTTTFGSYPQTYVGDTMREQLENWFSSNNPALVKTYATEDGTEWKAYEYNGDLYARGTETKKNSDSVYKDGTSPTSKRISWFKVEPLKWYILNYDEWKSGQEKIELYATQILTGKDYFNSSGYNGNDWATSDIRSWCNNKFFYDAFSIDERSIIETTALKNCKTNEYKKDPSTWTGEDTADKIYLKSYYELGDSNGVLNGRYIIHLCSGTDFAIGNALTCSSGTSYATNYGNSGGQYWLRSAGDLNARACIVGQQGVRLYNSSVYELKGVRPALRLSI